MTGRAVPNDRGPERRVQLAYAAALFAVLVLLSTRLLASAVRRHVLLTDESPLLYHAATLGFNYFDFGFLRRGLGGSIVLLLGPNLLLGTAIFHVLSAAAVATSAALLFARLRRPPLQCGVFALLLLALMMRWAEDPGRTDLIVAALLAAAAVAVTRGRFAWACAWVAVGLAVHETAVIFGVPLLVGLLVDQQRWRGLDRQSLVRGGAVLIAGLVLYGLAAFLPHADVPTMVSDVRARLPLHLYVDWAIYFAVSGVRGVRTSLCQNLGDPTYPLHLTMGLLVIGVYALLLRERRGPVWVSACLVSLPPFLFLGVVANDISRWTVLAAFNVWLLSAAAAGQTESAPGRRPLSQLLAAALVIPLIHPKTWPIDDPIFSPAPVIDHLVQRLGGPRTPRFADALARCDPQWRSVLETHSSSVRP